MNILTMKSDEARNRWRDLIDAALAGGQVIIERYNKPMAVLVGYEQWQRMQRRLVELETLHEAKQALARIDRGEAKTTSHEELKSGVLSKRRN